MRDKWDNDDWNTLDQDLQDEWDDPTSLTDDDLAYQAQVKAELVVKLQEFMTFSTKQDLERLIKDYL